MKKIVFVAALCCLFAAFGLTSCSDVHMQAAYGIGIHSFYANGDDFMNFCNYLREKQVPFEDGENIVVFEGKSQEDCDKKAVEFFNQQAAKLSYDEVTALLQYPESFTVEYSIVASKKNPDDPTRTLGAWRYPLVTIFD